MAISLYNRNWILLSFTLLRCYNFRPASLFLSLLLNSSIVFLFKWAHGKVFFFFSWRIVLASIFFYAMLCDHLCFILFIFINFVFIVCIQFLFGWWESRGKGQEHKICFWVFCVFMLLYILISPLIPFWLSNYKWFSLHL